MYGLLLFDLGLIMEEIENIDDSEGDGLRVGERKQEIARAVSGLSYDPGSTDIAVDVAHTIKLPVNEILSLDTAFSSLPNAVRTVAKTIQIPTAGNLFSATTAGGAPVFASQMQVFKDGTGLLGSTVSAAHGFDQVRFHEVAAQSAQMTTAMPYDPTTLFMAAMLLQVNQKLDAIQETQEEMLEYLRQKDKAALRGDLETLTDILTNYRFNWNNETYKTNKHIQVQRIRQEAERSIIQLRAQVSRALGASGPLHIHREAEDRMGKVVDDLKEYQLALHLYAFSSFLEVVLLENYDSGYLASVAQGIDERDLAYRELYSKCYDAIEELSRGSLDTMALGGLSAASKALGGLLSQTPLKEIAPLDEVAEHVGKDLETVQTDMTEQLMKRILEVKPVERHPFVDNIYMTDRLYNSAMLLMADEKNIYLLRVGGE